MECINKCGNEAQGRSKYCGDTCKVAYNRNKRNTVTVTDATVTQTVTGTTPAYVEAINEQSVRSRVGGCKVAIPGDEDYTGVCEKVDGQWRAKPEHTGVRQ